MKKLNLKKNHQATKGIKYYQITWSLNALSSMSTAKNLSVRDDFCFSKVHLRRDMSFQQCGMCDQKRLRSACAYAQSVQTLC